MTAFVALTLPRVYTRSIAFAVSSVLRMDLKKEYVWWNRHAVHSFDIPWQVLTTAQRLALIDFFTTCRGATVVDIAYTDPWDSVVYTCRLDMDTLVTTAPDPAHWSGSIRLVEVSGWSALVAAGNFPATVPFQTPYSVSLNYRTELQKMVDDTEVRYEDWSTNVTRWTCGGDALTNAQAADLIACFEGAKGPYTALTFVDPATGYTNNVRFVENVLVHRVAYPTNSIRMTLEEQK